MFIRFQVFLNSIECFHKNDTKMLKTKFVLYSQTIDTSCWYGVLLLYEIGNGDCTSSSIGLKDTCSVNSQAISVKKKVQKNVIYLFFNNMFNVHTSL